MARERKHKVSSTLQPEGTVTPQPRFRKDVVKELRTQKRTVLKGVGCRESSQKSVNKWLFVHKLELNAQLGISGRYVQGGLCMCEHR